MLTIYKRKGDGFGVGFAGAFFFGFCVKKGISLFYYTNRNETVRTSYEYERFFGEAEKPGIYPLFLFYFVFKEGKITKKEAETYLYQVSASIVGMNGLEPSISCSQSRRHSR